MIKKEKLPLTTGYFYLTIGDNRYPVSGLEYQQNQVFSQPKKTDAQGMFQYQAGTTLTFNLGPNKISLNALGEIIDQYDFPSVNAANLSALLLQLDSNGLDDQRITLDSHSFIGQPFSIDLNLPNDVFRRKLLKHFEITGYFQTNHPKTGQAIGVENLTYHSSVKQGKTLKKGAFQYHRNQPIRFFLADNTPIGSAIKGQKILTPAHFAYPISTNLTSFLLSADEDQQLNNGIQLNELAKQISHMLSDKVPDYAKTLKQQLTQHNRSYQTGYTPSLGINLEAPQAEADSVGQPMAFVDIFRTARPFKEFLGKIPNPDITFDKQGWPTAIPKGQSVYTLLLQSLPEGAIPFGEYTVLYDGEGILQYQGLGKLIKARQGRDTILIDKAHSTINRLIVRINKTNPSNPLRNIRIIMPGGLCDNDPYRRVEGSFDCKKGQYQSFVSMLRKDRNTIIFNPDYLRFLKQFKVLRMMNFMEASHRIPRSCYQFKGDQYNQCVLQDYHWKDRPKMDDASWGGSYRTDASQRHGVPIEVVVALANQLKVHPWLSIQHNATNDYIMNVADYFESHLDPELTIYLEYSNEVWNGIFWAAHYARLKGRQLNLDPDDKNPYREGYRYYAKRASELFSLWNEFFDDPTRTIRIAGSYIASPDLTKSILEYEDTYLNIDAIAVAPYFYACWDLKHSLCQGKQLRHTTSVDEIFEMLNNPNDPYTVTAQIKHTEKQVALTKRYDIDLFAYEGGQHLTVRWGDKTLSKEEKESLQSLFSKVNKDSRIIPQYKQLLSGWKASGGKLFMMFTMPQTQHRWGNWGTKEHLNQKRDNAPKYDGYMQFQENLLHCGMEGCNN